MFSFSYQAENGSFLMMHVTQKRAGQHITKCIPLQNQSNIFFEFVKLQRSFASLNVYVLQGV